MSAVDHRAAPATPAAAPPAGRTRRRGLLQPSYWFLVPALVVYGLVMVGPALSGAFYAFTDWSGVGDFSFVGLGNFRRILSEPQAVGALRNTVVLTAVAALMQNVLGLLLALGMHTAIRSRNVLRTVFFAPVVVSPVVVAFVWRYLFAPGPSGGINAVLGAVGLDGLQQDWLGDPSIALWSIAILYIWQHAGYSMVIYLAGLQGIGEDVYEAAALDGARRWARFRHITFPLLASAVTINVILATIGGLKLFDEVFALTGGGPGYATETLSTLTYKQAFVFGRFGYSTALALVLTAFVAVVSLVQLAYLRRREERI